MCAHPSCKHKLASVADLRCYYVPKNNLVHQGTTRAMVASSPANHEDFLTQIHLQHEGIAMNHGPIANRRSPAPPCQWIPPPRPMFRADGCSPLIRAVASDPTPSYPTIKTKGTHARVTLPFFSAPPLEPSLRLLQLVWSMPGTALWRCPPPPPLSMSDSH